MPCIGNTDGAGTAAGLGVVAGFLFLMGFILLQINVKINGVVLSATFAKLGVLVPTVLSLFLYHERLMLTQTIGFLLALVAIVLINMDKGSGSAKYKTALVLLLLSNGFADAMAKIYEEHGSPLLEDFYLIFTFVSAFAFSFLFVLIKHEKVYKMDILMGIILGIPNYYSVRFLMKALSDIEAVITYPTYSVAGIAVITLAGVFVFREKLNKRQKSSVFIIMISLVLLNI